MTSQRVPSVVLRNKGVPVEVAIVEDNKRLLADDEAPRTTQSWVRFDANAMADLEEAYGSLDAFDEAAKKTPTVCLRKALAICWNVPPRTAGLMMLDGKGDDYSTALAVALALANGVDPQSASDLLEEGVRTVSEARKQRSAAVKELITAEEKARREAAEELEAKQAEELAKRPQAVEAEAEAATPESPGTNGSGDGSALAAQSMSSGD